MQTFMTTMDKKKTRNDMEELKRRKNQISSLDTIRPDNS